jgi:adenosine deaminase
VSEAVRDAGARRIGHGTDIANETDAEALATEMAAKGVLVEVNLSSNAAILEVSGRAHPYAWLRQRNVPVSLSTDDAGILRIDLSGEYARAAGEGASYQDLKTSARNALAFSFLAGRGLWEDPGVYRRPARACAGQVGAETPRPGACADLVASSDKAREQWRHEALLKRFESGLR